VKNTEKNVNKMWPKMPTLKYSDSVHINTQKKHITINGRGIIHENTMPSFTTLRFSSRWHTELRDLFQDWNF